MPHTLALMLAVVATLALSALGLVMLRRQPEPDPSEPDAAIKPSYASLVQPWFVGACLGLSLATSTALLLLPSATWPLWIILGSTTLVLVACDARTTWLPLGLTRVCWALTAASLGVGALLTLPNPAGIPTLLAGAVLGALACAGIFWLLWRISGKFGFGDVRLALITGAVSGSLGFDFWWAALFLGTLAAAVSGLVVLWWRRGHPSALGKAFAYGPGLWLGPYLAVLAGATPAPG